MGTDDDETGAGGPVLRFRPEEWVSREWHEPFAGL